MTAINLKVFIYGMNMDCVKHLFSVLFIINCTLPVVVECTVVAVAGALVVDGR